MRPSLAALLGIIGVTAISGDSHVISGGPGSRAPSIRAHSHSGHGSRRSNKAGYDYSRSKRRRQIARASRQLNRRRAA